MIDVQEAMRDLHERVLESKGGGSKKPGEFTTSQYAEENNVAVRTARDLLAYAIKNGLAERRKAGGKANMYYYRYIEKEG